MMKKPLTSLFALLFAVALFATACGSDDVTETSTGAGDSTEQPAVTPAPATEGPDAGDQGDDGDDGNDGDTQDTGDNGDDGAVSENIQRLWVGPQLVDCVGVAPQKCLLIRRTEDGQAEYFYDSIEGFTHEAGTSYVIDVEVTQVENPPMLRR